MRRFRFTVAKLDEITTERAREFVHDEQVPALAVQVTATGSKSFYVVKRLPHGKLVQRLGALHEIPIPKARAMAAEIVLKAAAGDPFVMQRRPALPFSQVAEEYLAYAKEHRAYETYLTYVKHWQRYLKPWAGNRPLRAIRRHDVTAFHEHVGQNHGRITANRVMALLRAIINRAIREHELDIPNPARGVSLYRETKRIRRLEPSELPAFFRAMEEEPNPDMRDFFLLALFTGARKGNLMSMRWEDINFERSLWIVPAAKSKTGHQLFVVLSSHAMAILVRRRAEAGSSPYAFPGKCDGHIGAPSNAWARILQRAGLAGLHIHDLRRSLASFQIDTGTPLEVIQKTLGHESKVTTEIYARLALEPVRASVERATEEMLRRARG